MTPAQFTLYSAFMLGLLGMALHRTHLLSTLLCLEAMMLALYLSLTLWALGMYSANSFGPPLMLLAFSACEASAGLSLLVATARTHGTSQMKNMNLLQC